jgi:putative membrane protein
MMWGSDISPIWLWLYGLLSLGAVVVLIVWTVRVFRDDSSSPVGPRRSAARRELDERFARGELSSEQYNQQVRDLNEKD